MRFICSAAIILMWVLSPLSVQGAQQTYQLSTLTRMGGTVRQAQMLLAGKKAPDKSEVNRVSVRLLKYAVGSSDPMLLPLMRWVRASLFMRSGQKRLAKKELRLLAKMSNGLADLARAELKDLSGTSKDKIKALSDVFKISPAVHNYEHQYVYASSELKRLGKGAQATKLLANTLKQSLGSGQRIRLQRHLAELFVSIGQWKEGVEAYRAMWWRHGGSETGDAVAERLEKLRSPLGVYEKMARLALHAKSSTRRKTLRALRKIRTKNTRQRQMMTWAKAVVNSHSKTLCKRELPKIIALKEKLKDVVVEPYYLVGLGVMLRRVDRDVEAARTFLDMARRHPEHHLAAEAATHAGYLFVRRGRRKDGYKASELALKLSRRGPIQRSALWQAGFGAFLAKRYRTAEKHFRLLKTRYGGEREGYGILWGQKAAYWYARSGELLGKHGAARVRYERLVMNYPLSWYATLAEARLWKRFRMRVKVPRQSLKKPLRKLKVLRRRVLDIPVAFIRLGMDGAARLSLESLLRAGYLSDSGRMLLAALYHKAGDEEHARKLVRKGGVLAAMPSTKDQAMYASYFPRRYRRMMVSVVKKTKAPLCLLAGLIYVESRFSPRVRSGAGATGLTQLMPGTARSVGKHLLRMRVTRRKIRHPRTNMMIGSRFLRELLEHFQRNPALALASYNAGHGAGRAWWRRRVSPQTDVFVELIPFKQARNYVRRVFSMARLYRALWDSSSARLYMPMSLPDKLGPFYEELKERREQRRLRRKKRRRG